MSAADLFGHVSTVDDGVRSDFDFYETPSWATRSLLQFHLAIRGTVNACDQRTSGGGLMAVYRTENGRGWMHVNFGRNHGPLPCRAPRLSADDPSIGKICGRMSVALCDAPAGQDLAGKPHTCDMPLCEHHRTRADANVDYCPRHAHLAPRRLEFSE